VSPGGGGSLPQVEGCRNIHGRLGRARGEPQVGRSHPPLSAPDPVRLSSRSAPGAFDRHLEAERLGVDERTPWEKLGRDVCAEL
jgi:hypothetical protein